MKVTVAELTETFLRDVRELGRAQGLTHHEIACRADIGPDEFSKLTHGRRSFVRGPSLATLMRLAKAVDCALALELVPERRRGVRG